jgi:uncharacterized protein YhaN
VKIQGFLVERFGALRNYQVRDLPGGLTIFYGPNGAGKSTLFAFLRHMLFGWAHPDAERRAAAPQYDSCAGRLDCAGPGGVYTITRKADLPSQLYVTRPDGEEGGDAALECLFGGADGRLIGSLLAFDVHDLRELPPLSSPGLRERLFPAGAGRRRSIRRALDTIQVRKSEIAQRADGDLQQLTTVPVDLQARIDRSTRAALRLGQLLQAQAQARFTLDLRTRTISDLKAERTRYGALIDLSPVWQELTQARRELENMEPINEFPADLEERLEQALAARGAAQRSVEQLIDEERPPRREVSVTLNDPTGGMFATPAARIGTVVRQSVRLQELGATGTDRGWALMEPLSQFGNLDSERDERRPEHVDRMHPRAEDLTVWQRRLKEAVEAVRDLERELEATTRTVRELERARNEISTTLSRPEPPSAAVLDEEARLVQHVRTALAGLAIDQISRERWQDLIAERNGTVRTLETHVTPLPSNALPRAAWFAAVLGIAAAVSRYAWGDTVGLSLLVTCSLTSAIGAAVQRSRRTTAIDEDSSRRACLTAARGELEEACQSLLRHQERAARCRFDISVDSVRLGLPPMPSDRQLQEREAELDGQRRQRGERDAAQAALAEALSSLMRSEELRRQHAQALLAAQALERQTILQWYQGKVHAGVVDNLSALRGAGAAVRTEVELLENCRRLGIQIAESDQNATEWNTRARAALTGTWESEGSAESVPMGGVMVAQPVREHSPALQAAQRRLRQCKDALAHLFSQAGVSDEAAFCARLATYRRHLALTQTIRVCETRCSERVSPEPGADAILRELPEGHVEEWRHGAARAVVELTGAEAARDEVLRQLRQLDADVCAASAESADLPVLEVERSGLATDVLTTVRSWRTLVLAASLLEEAERHVERESQPAALRRASEVLSAVTFSRYERLVQSDDQRELLVLDTKSGWKAVGQLSRGTVEQLYFSVRLGLAEESAQSSAGHPLVIDDVLDHFDPKRSRAMASQVVELSRRHQVLVFTRRPDTCELLRSLDPAANVITMQEL